MPLKSSPIKIAYGSVPKDGGTFTFYRHLKEALRPHGIEMYCVSVGQQEASGWNAAFADESCVQLAANEADRKKQAQAVVAWIEKSEIDLVMPINSVALLSAIRHLPPRAQVVMRCANAFEHGYRITVLDQERAARIVATTPRHVRDLTATYGADPAKVVLIPHGIDPEPYENLPARQTGNVLSLGFLGRLEHNQKGVFYLPGIIERLRKADVPFLLNIAGEGEHRPELEKQLAGSVAAGCARFVGRLTPNQVPGFLAGVDAFLFPSRFEGFGFALVEAMMAGCVPVSSRIEGITDFILEEGQTGLLCGIGKEDEFARAIERLHLDRALLRRMNQAAAASARTRFHCERMAADYANLFTGLIRHPTPRMAPLPWTDFALPAPFRPSWRSFVPKPVKKMIRAVLGSLPRGTLCADPHLRGRPALGLK